MILPLDNNVYYYSSDGKIFTSKIEAIEYGIKTDKRIRLYYYDHLYDKLNWKTEPTESVDYYYKQQAQKIRDEYDYVVLFYSGGYDSTNILETFHFNNIKLDKIVCVGAFKQDSAAGVDENHNGELYHNSFPYLVELGLQSITQICDYTDYFSTVKNFTVYEYGENWIDRIGAWYSPHHWFWHDIDKYVVPSGMENKKVALVWGKDKPVMCNEGGPLGFKFTDVVAFGYGGTLRRPGVDRINFYWDPTYPLIVQKQAHIMKNSIDPFKNADSKVYNLRKPLIYKSPKTTNNILSLRDSFLKKHTDSEIFNFYKYGIRSIMSKIDLMEIRPIKSKSYHV